MEGDSKTIINLTKLLLCISSLSSIKDKNLTKVSFLEGDLQNEYFSSVESYIELDNNEKDDNNLSFDLDNLDKLNLSESLMKELKDVHNNYISQDKKKEEEKKALEDKQNSSGFESIYFGKNADIKKFDENLNMDQVKKEILNNEEIKPIKVEKQIYVNNQQQDNNIKLEDIKDLQNINTDKPTAVIVETKTYCNMVKIGKDGVPINASMNNNNINVNIDNKNLSTVNEISLYLNGGDFLHKKINILEETLLKNSDMYNTVIDKYEKDKKNLMEEIENMKNNHKAEIENLTKEKEKYLKEMKDLSSSRNDNQIEIENIKKELNNMKVKYDDLLNNKNMLEKENNENKNKHSLENSQKDNEISELKKKIDEFNRQLNKKDIENEQLKKAIDELKKQKEKEFNDFQKQIKDITFLKDQEISMLNDKIKSEQNSQNDKSLVLEKNFENYKINSNKMYNELMDKNNELKRQINEIPLLKQDIEKYKKMYETIDDENAKIHSDIINLQDKFEAGGRLNKDLNQKIIVLERKLKSDPYFAKEIMSKTLFNFAFKIMSENN